MKCAFVVWKGSSKSGLPGAWASIPSSFQISLPRWDHARGFLSPRNDCTTFLLELLVHIVLTCAIPSIFPCPGAGGGYALNNAKFLPDSCAKKTHSFQLHLRALGLFLEYRFLVHSGVSIPPFIGLKDQLRNSLLRETSQPSEVLFVLFHSGICFS